MSKFPISLQQVSQFIKKGYSSQPCPSIHPDSCNSFCLNYVCRVWSSTYKTYGVVYLIQLLFKLKDIRNNPPLQLAHWIIAYIKSTSLTAVQMMLMRRILCFLNKYYRNTQKNLLLANFLSGFYLLIESMGRQCQIALYQVKGTTEIIFNMMQRRKIVNSLPKGECLVFSFAIALLTFYYFNNNEAYRNNYIKYLFDKFFKNI